MAKILFSSFPRLETERLLLRPLKDSDENEIFALHADEKNAQYINRSKATSIKDAQNFIQKINNGIAEDKWLYWAISLKNEDTLIGTICLWNFSEDRQKAETGFELNPHYQRKGIMHEALKKVIHFSFETIKLEILEAYVNTQNIASIKLLEKANFTHQSTIWEAYSSKEEPTKMFIYSMSPKHQII